MAVRNAAGLGEEVEVAVKVGSQSSSEGRLSATRGRLGGLPYEGVASILQATQSYEATSSYVERLRGAIINISRSAPALTPRPQSQARGDIQGLILCFLVASALGCIELHISEARRKELSDAFSGCC